MIELWKQKVLVGPKPLKTGGWFALKLFEMSM